jgi:hypothetical protein
MSENNCQPGDITVRASEGAFLVGYVLKASGHGLPWRLINTASDFEAAVALARSLAREIGVQAWIEGPNDTYEQIALTARE